jgi:putative tryptophan/tyrosine transport system substrate-binding protein
MASPSNMPVAVATMPSEVGGTRMKRREFIALLGGAAATWPLAARAQRPAKPVIGFLGPASPSTFASRIEAFRLGLRDFGYVEGTNITVEYRWADGRYERLPELAAELVRSNVDLIVTHGTPGSLAAKRATTTIPIVMANIGDPVATGVVASIARPGGNITGHTFFNPELRAKRVELLKEVMPRITHVAVVLNPDNPASGPEFQAMETAAQALNIKLQPFRLREPSELVSAFERMEQTHAEAVETGDDVLSVTNVGAIVALAARGRLLSIGPEDVPRAGGIIGYGVDFVAVFRRAGFFVDKILKGANPADLPIERVSKFQFILNRKAARALGFEIPQSILLRADEVIE